MDEISKIPETPKIPKVELVALNEACGGFTAGVYPRGELSRLRLEQLAGRMRIYSADQPRYPSMVVTFCGLPLMAHVTERDWAKLQLAVIAGHAQAFEI